jgi:hypothetical protein
LKLFWSDSVQGFDIALAFEFGAETTLRFIFCLCVPLLSLVASEGCPGFGHQQVLNWGKSDNLKASRKAHIAPRQKTVDLGSSYLPVTGTSEGYKPRGLPSMSLRDSQNVLNSKRPVRTYDQSPPAAHAFCSRIPRPVWVTAQSTFYGDIGHGLTSENERECILPLPSTFFESSAWPQ